MNSILYDWHALNQRSPARSGKVKGVLGNFNHTD